MAQSKMFRKLIETSKFRNEPFSRTATITSEEIMKVMQRDESSKMAHLVGAFKYDDWAEAIRATLEPMEEAERTSKEMKRRIASSEYDASDFFTTGTSVSYDRPKNPEKPKVNADKPQMEVEPIWA